MHWATQNWLQSQLAKHDFSQIIGHVTTWLKYVQIFFLHFPEVHTDLLALKERHRSSSPDNPAPKTNYGLHSISIRVSNTCFIQTSWNSSGDEFIFENVNINLKFESFPYTDLALAVEMLPHGRQGSGPCLNIKTVLSTYGDFHVKDKTAVRTSYF